MSGWMGGYQRVFFFFCFNSSSIGLIETKLGVRVNIDDSYRLVKVKLFAKGQDQICVLLKIQFWLKIMNAMSK